MILDNLAYASLIINTTCIAGLCSYGICRLCRKTFGFVQQKSQQFNQLCLDIGNISTELRTMNTELRVASNNLSSCVGSLYGIEDNGSLTKIANTLAISKDYTRIISQLVPMIMSLFDGFNPINYAKKWIMSLVFGSHSQPQSQPQPAQSTVPDEFQSLLNTLMSSVLQGTCPSTADSRPVASIPHAETLVTTTPVKSNINITRADSAPEKNDDLTIIKPLCPSHKETDASTTTQDKSAATDKPKATDIQVTDSPSTTDKPTATDKPATDNPSTTDKPEETTKAKDLHSGEEKK